ncbi:uncharacterized protein LOC107268141 [Cephus cinctus]|uniref:Uncharacterized protein LOC107268141 n=1 Tax=Cephus cinctus TaxID=211228 RepID=A0AAJ7BX50_CEPCN|nr:uncharacterized protein LOC107268141 [Cephus cinctus]
MSLDSECDKVKKIMRNEVACNGSEGVEKNEEDAEGSIMLNSEDIDEKQQNTMKGDTVGDTVYSGKWIITTLISLSKVYENGWNDDLESDLCMLWDMTADKDIVSFLMENEFLKMAEFTLKVSNEPRLTEIILGIIGNMCCQSEVLDAVANRTDLAKAILDLVASDDPETLIQLLRLLRTAVWDILKNRESAWSECLRASEILGHAIVFIMESSTNDDLLTAAMDFLQSISALGSLFGKLFDIARLLPALLESFTQLIRRDEDVRPYTQTELKIIENWLTIISNVAQMDPFKCQNVHENEQFRMILNVLVRILQPYIHSYNLIPIEERSALCIHQCVDLISSFQRNQMYATPEIIYVIVTILSHLGSAMKVDIDDDIDDIEADPDNIANELYQYLLRFWIETLRIYESDRVAEILQLCENTVIKQLIKISESHVKTCHDAMEKLMQTKSLLR